MVSIETQRLRIRPLTLKDEAFILKLLNTPSWLRFIGDRQVHTREDARKYLLKGPMASYRIWKFGLYRVSLKETDEPLGMCGLLKRPVLDYPDLGYALLPTYERKGFTTEAARAVLEDAHSRLDLSQVLAITDLDNVASIRVLEKLGFVFQKTTTLDKPEEVLNLYQLDLPMGDRDHSTS